MSKSYDPLFDPNFVGYNCREEDSDDVGVIENIGDYAEEYYQTIIESLPDYLKVKANEKGLLAFPDKSDEKFGKWAKKTCSFFKACGVKWIFVREDIPPNDFESQFFYVSIPEEKILCSFDYVFDDDEIRIIVYVTKGPDKIKPRLIIVPEEFPEDLEDNFKDNLEDDEEADEEPNYGESYWEEAWKCK